MRSLRNLSLRSPHRIVGHGGGAPGINTRVAWYPDDGWTLIILTNLDRAGSHAFWHFEELLGIR